ncbi:MAG TPA: DUF2971 domain-containing protein [Paludibacter sp.]
MNQIDKHFLHNGFYYKILEELPSYHHDFIQIKSNSNYDLPKELYHYYRLNSNSADSFIHNYVYANHPFDFNDPFDCNRDLISFNRHTLKEILNFGGPSPNPTHIKDLFRQDKSTLHDLLKWRVYDVIYSQLGIFCTSTKKYSMDMWSHYSEHRGFVVNYDVSMMPKNHWGPFPINYTDNFKKIEYQKFKEWSFVYQSNVKAKCWKYEDEWRLLFWGPHPMSVPFRKINNAQDRKVYYDPAIIKEIVLGFYFFEIFEYQVGERHPDSHLIKLKKNIQIKRKILEYIISNKIPTSLIFLKRKTNSDLDARPIEISKISPNKYKFKYMD